VKIATKTPEHHKATTIFSNKLPSANSNMQIITDRNRQSTSTVFKYAVIFPLSQHLWCLPPLSTIFQLYRGGQLYWWRNPEKTTDLSHVTDQTLSHNFVLKTPRLSEIRTHKVTGDIDCIGSYKSNYHMITTMTAPVSIVNFEYKFDSEQKILK